MRLSAAIPCVLVFCVAGACDEAPVTGGEAARPQPASNVAEQAPPTAPVAPSVPPATPEPALSQGAVEALLQQWLEAQNRGDFAAYSAIYAEDFRGTRRTRELVKRFDRAGWLVDRQRMFKKPMAVQANAAVIGVKGATATVDFVQAWKSGAFSDVGSKRMVVRATAQGPRITSEDMLESIVADSTAGAAIGYVVVEAGARLIAVLDGPIDAQYQGEPALGGAGEETVAVWRGLNARMSARHAAHAGREVVLVADGKTCPGKLGEAAAYKILVPPEGDPAHATLRDAARKSPEEVAAAAKQMWNDLETEVYVAAPIEGRCQGAVAALPVAATPPAVLRRHAVEGAAAEQLLASFDPQPAGRALAKHYLENVLVPEDKGVDLAQLGFAQYAYLGHETYRFDRGDSPVLTTLTYYYQGCELGVDAFAVSPATGAPSWRAPLPSARSVVPLAVFDADADGSYEAVVQDVWGIDRWLVQLERGRVLQRVRVSVFRCGC